MQFLDQAKVLVVAGAGGNGCSAMDRQPFTRYPRRSGGNGGDGGDVIVTADPQLSTLLDIQFHHEFRAQRGGHGSGKNKTGRRGIDTLIRVPVGTLIYDEDIQNLLRDLILSEDSLIVARGGRGGVGNANAPMATAGKTGEQRNLRFELKLLADVGLIGCPNAGKSSLLSRLSTARPKIASYPFTTKTPVLGVVSVGPYQSFVACDIPGLIEGAHEGRGLGIQFLRHVERTRLLVHIIDMASVDGRDPVTSYEQVNQELAAYNPVLATRPQLVVANKMDLPESRDALAQFERRTGQTPIAISCATNAGIPQLIPKIWQRWQQLQTEPEDWHT